MSKHRNKNVSQRPHRARADADKTGSAEDQGLEAALREAMAHHEKGDLSSAKSICVEILRATPDQFEALHMLGIIHNQEGNPARGAKLIQAALKQRPDAAAAHCNLGVARQALGQLEKAAASYRRALEIRPDYAQAHNNLGSTLRDLNRLDQAEACFRRALEIRADFPQAHFNLGNVLHAQGRFEDAAASYRRAIAADPGFAEAHYNLGNTLETIGQLEHAAACYRSAVEIRPDHSRAHNNLGNVLRALGRLDEAEESYRRALELRPDDALTHSNLGTALHELGRLDEAETSYRNALAHDPGHPEAHYNLGNLLQARGRYDDAAASYRSALKARPDYAEAHNNLGNALKALRQFEEAEACYRRALDLRPDFAEAHTNLGNALQAIGRSEQAVASYRQGLAIRPDDAETHNNLGNALKRLKRFEEANESYCRALEIDPDHENALGMAADVQRQICDWSTTAEITGRLMDRIREERAAVAPFQLLSSCDDPAVLLRCARLYARKWSGAGVPPMAAPSPAIGDRIRLGYLSSDFREHVVGHLMVEVIERHDRSRFEVIGLSHGPDDGSAMRQRLRDAFDQFHDLRRAGDREATQRIAELGINVLVDLNGYTTNTRIELLARRLAPIQVTYLGYPGTTGADFIDYAMVDPFVVPPDQQAYYSECLVHLPDCFQVNDTKREIAKETPTRADCGLPEEGIVFCCMNNSFKITPEMFDIWMRLLAARPGSVLWLLVDNRTAEKNLRREAAARGVEPRRLVFAQRTKSPIYLARYRLADLFLDTRPYNAGATASDALWMGVPVLTSSGRTYAARMAGSLLHAVGLPELVTESLEDYEALALSLSAEPGRLQAIKAKLARNRATAPLFDSKRFCGHLESAYERMLRIWQAGEKPRPFAVE